MDRFVLKFLWLDKAIAVALDQKIGDRTIPLTEFYFWPQKDAWEEMKLFLEKKSWVSQSDVIIILNQVTEVINYWQEKDNLPNKELNKVRAKFPNSLFVGY
uniref:putative ribosomal protein PSRP-3/Ycf65 n=1 Tax=Strombomonas costata TaxID=161230 RepID=UPI0023AA7E19|nr:putative ribosomal protein PSRP-3/Ycf65 [Strombomonas costata]WCH63632.1 putative ribosomal protein PSRP-3/Ycf65 [Strombomonas costata]